MNMNTVYLLLWTCWLAALAAGEALGAPCAVLYVAHPAFDTPRHEGLTRTALTEGPGAGSILYAGPGDAWSKKEALASVPPRPSTATFEAKVEACARSQDAEASPRLVVYIHSHGRDGAVCRPEAPLPHGDLVAMLLSHLDASRGRAGRPLPLTFFYDACHAHSLAGFLEAGGAAAKEADGRPRYLIDLYSASAADRGGYSTIMPRVITAIARANRKDGRPGPCFDPRDDGLFAEACFPNTHRLWSSRRGAPAAKPPVERLAGLLDASETSRGFAIHALGGFGSKAEPYFAAVLRKVKDADGEDWDVVEAAGSYFSRVKADAAVDALRETIQDASASDALRKRAVALLGAIRSRKAVLELAGLADGPDEAMAAAAVHAMRDLDAGLLEAVPADALLRWLERTRSRRTITALLGRKREIAVLVGFLGDKDYGFDASEALVEIGPAAVHAVAEALLRAADEEASSNAAMVLGRLPSPAACLALVSGTTDEDIATIEHSVSWVDRGCKGQNLDLRSVYLRALSHLASLHPAETPPSDQKPALGPPGAGGGIRIVRRGTRHEVRETRYDEVRRLILRRLRHLE